MRVVRNLFFLFIHAQKILGWNKGVSFIRSLDVWDYPHLIDASYSSLVKALSFLLFQSDCFGILCKQVVLGLSRWTSLSSPCNCIPVPHRIWCVQYIFPISTLHSLYLYALSHISASNSIFSTRPPHVTVFTDEWGRLVLVSSFFGILGRNQYYGSAPV